MGSDHPDLSVVIVTHNGRESALRTIVCARAKAGDLACEWIVVDSGSHDGVPDAIAERWSDIRVIRLANVGFAAANNVAFRFAHGRHVLLLNPDVEILAGELSELVHELDRRPGVGVAGVVHFGPDGQLLPSVMRFPSPLRQLGEALIPSRFRPSWLEEPLRPGPWYRNEMVADWVSGAFLLVRSEALRAAGGLDERFFLYSEETDLCLRLRRAGWTVQHLPVITIVHYGGACDRPELAAQLCRSKLLYAAKHYGRAGRSTARAALAIGHALRLAGATPRAWTRGARVTLNAERAALAVVLDASEPRIPSGSP